MIETLKNAWKVEETRKKLFYTLLLIIVFRIGSVFVTAPFISTDMVAQWLESNSENSALGYLNLFSGGAMEKATVFALSIQPFINASIIVHRCDYCSCNTFKNRVFHYCSFCTFYARFISNNKRQSASAVLTMHKCTMSG